jgi:hypothetical protein
VLPQDFRLRIPLASPSTATFPLLWRVGSNIDDFEACSMFTHVAARMVRWPNRVFSRSASGHSSPPDRPECFRLEREFAAPDFHGENSAPWQGTHNIFFERLSRSLKYEDIFLKVYGSPAAARSGIGAWLLL